MVLRPHPLAPPLSFEDQATAGLWVLVLLRLVVGLTHRSSLSSDLLGAETLRVEQLLGLLADVLEQLVIRVLLRALFVVLLGLEQALGVGVCPTMSYRVVLAGQHQHGPAIALGGQDVTEEIHVVGALTDQDLLAGDRIVEPRAHRVVPPAQARVALRVGLHVGHVVRVVHTEHVAALARGLATDRGRDPIAVLVVDVAVLLVLRRVQVEHPAVPLLEPGALEDVPGLHRITQCQVVSV